MITFTFSDDFKFIPETTIEIVSQGTEKACENIAK